MAYPDDITLDTNDVDGGTPRSLKTLEWHAAQFVPLLGPLNAAAQDNPAAASASIASLLRGILANTGNGIVLTANMLQAVTAAMTGTSSTALFAAGGSGVKNMLSSIVLVNSSAVNTVVEILDGAAIIGYAYAPANSMSGVTFNTPLRGSANTALNVRNVTTAANVYATGTGWKE